MLDETLHAKRQRKKFLPINYPENKYCMHTLVITTFSRDGYELYGQRLIETWIKYWPKEGYRLRIYVEHEFSVDDDRVELVMLNEVSESLIKFKNKCTHDLEAIADVKANKKSRNRILKTVKWCHKVYAMQHALNNNQHEHVIFLDGDTYTKDHVTRGALEALSNDCLFSVHFETLYSMRHYETGLIIFNCAHTQIADLKSHITDAYDTGEIFKLPKSWDGFWFALLAERRSYQVTDLAGGHFSGVFTNPTVKSILVHEAGNDKYEGKGFNTFSGLRNAH
jgi:hypothetical protein